MEQGTIHSALLGEIIGKHEAIEFAPLKRLTDLLVNQMSQVSDRHNQALEEMLTNALIQLPEKPITHLKKLLEIYLEVLSVNRSAVLNEKVLNQFAVWKATPGLTRLIASFGMLTHKPLDLATEK